MRIRKLIFLSQLSTFEIIVCYKYLVGGRWVTLIKSIEEINMYNNNNAAET